MKQLALLLAAAVGAFQGSLPVSEVSPGSGSVTEGIYRNQYFAFSYRLPRHLKLNTDDFVRQLTEKGHTEPQSHVLLSAYEETILPRVKEGVLIMADQAAYYGLEDGNAYLRKVTRFYEQQGTEVLRGSTECSFAGKKFFRGDYRGPGILFRVHTSVVSTVWRGYALSFLFFAGSPGRIEELVASLGTLEFHGPDVTPSNAGALPKPAQPLPLRVSSPRLKTAIVYKVDPIYPNEARNRGIQGKVRLGIVTTPQGTVKQVWVLEGHPLFMPAAMEAVEQWRFRRFLRNGQAVEVEGEITVEFRLPKK